LVLALALLAFVAAQPVPVPFTYCDQQPDHLHVITAEANPWPPVLGQDIWFSIVIELDEDVTAGNYEGIVWFDGIQLADEKGTLASLNISEIPSGTYNITKSKKLPWLPIMGDVKIQASLTDQNGDYVSCIVLEASIGAQPVRPVLQQLADSINSDPTVSWTAGHNAFFDHMATQEVRRLMGVKKNPLVHLPKREHYPASVLRALPAELDLRTRMFNNNTCIGPILDQGECGSCWAFGAAEAISDRLCMKSGGFLQLAPLDLVTCDSSDSGCDGGDPGSAWQYATGGLAEESCLPYLTANGGPIPTCDPSQEPCLNFVNTPSCPSTCGDGSAVTRSHAVGNVYGLSGEQQMMAEMDQNGPIEVAFTVYSDFLTYKSGVYTQQSQDALGGHAVKMIGYGTESGMDYWLCQNSWTTTWGDAGYFKIRRGTDECGIEDDPVAGTIASL